MKANSTQQEILLMTGTSLAHREWCRREDSGSSDHFTESEQLQERCWNGLLREMLPEIYETTDDGKGLMLRAIREASNFLEIDLGNAPAELDDFFSIDPYAFLEVFNSN